MSMLASAIALAAQVHRDKVDKGGRPYILHPLRVMLAQQNETAMIVAVLHDVVEDSREHAQPYTPERLREMGYAEEVLAALDGVTNRPGESYPDFIERAAANAIACQVKIADLEDNMDIRRLEEVGPWEAERLAKYLRSWQRLTGDK
ncbi:MAG: GTP pyrophosphokinase [Chloroflexota bacterium]